MKAKTRKNWERAVMLMLALVFILGTLLLYLPVGNQATPPTAPPVQEGAAGPADQGSTTVEVQTGPPAP